MKAIIAYVSTHHGNTEKVVNEIKKECGVEAFNVLEEPDRDLSDYDLIGLASGIYAAKFHPQMIAYAKEHLPQNKKIFYIMTSALDKDFSKSMAEAINGKNAEVVGTFSCKGYNTFGPFKLVGGTGKGHPDATDLANAVEFYRSIAK